MPTQPPAPPVQPLDVDKLGLPPDDIQELKEAVCDSLIERTRRAAAGEGEFGLEIFGAKPSRTLVSGFLLPSMDKNGDEIVSDIAISTHGMDVNIDGSQQGTIHVQPRFSMYVRVLPEADDIFDPRYGLKPIPRLKQEVADEIGLKVRERVAKEIPKEATAAARHQRKTEIAVEVHRQYGITLSSNQLGRTEAPTDGEDGEVVDEVRSTEVQIPESLGVDEEIPEKWLRLPVPAPALALPVPYDQATWEAAKAEYNKALKEVILTTFKTWIESEDGLLRAWRPIKAPTPAFWTKDNWDKFLGKVRSSRPDISKLFPNSVVELIVDVLEHPFEGGLLTVRFALENKKENDDKKENGLFQVDVTVTVPKNVLRQMRLERVKPSYHLSGFLQMPAMGVAGGVVARGLDGNVELHSSWAPRFVLPRIKPTKLDDVPVGYERLSDPGLDIDDLNELPDRMVSWIEDVKRHVDQNGLLEADLAPDENVLVQEENRYRNDLDAWNAEQARVRLGIELLKASQAAYERDATSREAIPYRAWLATNASFLDAAKMANPGWRLFQLAFVLAHIPTVASRMPEFEAYFREDYDEAKATLLYMSTGGGKSEAFFGILIFTLFFDRLRGKQRGVSAMIHYPLRLLTLQQAQRLMRLLAKAEMRRRDLGLGGASFEIGFWVGSSNTPNATTIGESDRRTDQVRDIPTWAEEALEAEEVLVQNNQSYSGLKDSWNKLPRCPFCDGETVLRIVPEQQHRLGIICTNEGCDWNDAHRHQNHPEPLPFILVDTDIYRRAPAVLLGTVDKLALIGNNPSTINKVAGMFGMARFVDPVNGLLSSPHRAEDINAAGAGGRQPVAPMNRGGREVFLDPFPSLIIQDEMHLLEESLGTFGGLFETTLFTWFKELAKLLGTRVCRMPGGSPRMPKIIAATATISDPNRQINVLYQKGVVQFPHPGPQAYRTFYGVPASFDGAEAKAERPVGYQVHPREEEANAPWARVYVSMLTNGRPHTATTVAVLSAFAVNISFFLKALCHEDMDVRNRAVDELIGALSDTALRNRHRRVIEKYRNNHEVLANLVDLHRIALTYVTNKKGGDQVMAALHSQAIKDHDRAAPNKALEIRDFGIDLISGGIDVKGIQAVIQRAEERLDFEELDLSKALRCIVATSAISHGVDVEKFNSMFFAGMPSDIAEYIQASSRVGRTHVGFSMLIPTPQNRRDRFIMEVHESFHRLLERMIAPPAIERWADKAMERVIPSLFQTFIAGVLYQQDAIAGGAARFPSRVDELRRNITNRQDQVRQACLDFVVRALGVDALTDEAQREHAKDLAHKNLSKVFNAILDEDRYAAEFRVFWQERGHGICRPMTSLRDVDEAGEIAPALNPRRGLTADSFDTAMTFIRKRRAGRSSASETDTETDNP